MRVDDHRVRGLDAGEGRAHPLDEHRGQAVGAVDVQPDAPLLRDGGHRGDVVDDAEVRRAAGRDDGEHRTLVGVEHLGERVAVQPATGIRGGGDDVDVHHLCRRGDGRVRLGAADDDPARRIRAPAVGVAAACGIPSRHQCRQVADRAALHEYSAGGGRQAELACEPVQHLVLGVDRAGALHPRSAVDRGCRDDDVERERGLARRGRDEGEVAGVVRRDARRSEHVLEQGDRPSRADAAVGDRARCQPREVVRTQRLVEGNVLIERAATRVVEHIVHRVGRLVRDGVHLLGARGRGHWHLHRSGDTSR